MPILEVTDGNGNLLPRAEIELTATSAYPRDEAKRFEFLEILCCRQAVLEREFEESLEIGKGEYLHLAQMLEVLMACQVSPSAVITNGLRRMTSGHAVGALLNQYLAVRADYDQPVPLEAHVEVLSMIYSGPLFPEPVASSESMLTKAWARYRSAAHLHAMLGWTNYHFDIELVNLPAWQYPDFYRYLLSFAEHRRLQAEQHGILDPDETWRVSPDYELIEFSFGLAEEPLPDEILGSIERPPLRTCKWYVEKDGQELPCLF